MLFSINTDGTISVPSDDLSLDKSVNVTDNSSFVSVSRSTLNKYFD